MKKRNVKFVGILKIMYLLRTQRSKQVMQCALKEKLMCIYNMRYSIPVAFKGSSSQSILKLEPSEMSEEI